MSCNENWCSDKAASSKVGIPPLRRNCEMCGCSHCKTVMEDTSCTCTTKAKLITTSFKIGDRVLIGGMFPGVVKYIGDLDSPYLNGKLYVGAKLDDPVGENDGMHKGKYFFRCPSMHGVIVPVEDVQLQHEPPCGEMKPNDSNRYNKCQACVEDSTTVKPKSVPTCDKHKSPDSSPVVAEMMPQTTVHTLLAPQVVTNENTAYGVESSQPGAVSTQSSFTSALVSNLPRMEAATPLPADTKLVDVNEFGEWVESWGGGLKGWSMAQTLQKLKDGQRRGEKEIKWQRTIEALEHEEEFGVQVRKISALRLELAKVRRRREESEQRIRLEVYETSDMKKSLEELKEDTKVVIDASKELAAKLREYRRDDIFEGCIDIAEMSA